MIILEVCESNFIKIVQQVQKIGLLNQDQKNELIGEILYIRQELQFFEKGIAVCKNTKFFFNFNSFNNKQLETTKKEFIYNARLSFITSLLSRFGDTIYDKRFSGYYRFTDRMLKKEFKIQYDDFVERNSTLSLLEIDKLIINALKIQQFKDDLFNDLHKQARKNAYSKIILLRNKKSNK